MSGTITAAATLPEDSLPLLLSDWVSVCLVVDGASSGVVNDEGLVAAAATEEVLLLIALAEADDVCVAALLDDDEGNAIDELMAVVLPKDPRQLVSDP